ncbi:glutamate--cysteine ligase [bacterium]|nr:glutamate--cysteine ligase [bacterium]
MIGTVDLAQSISEQFTSGCKQEQKIGVELERIPVKTDSYETVSYSEENGICQVLKEFSRLDGWDYITDNGIIIGLRNDKDTITLEPGCQFELSLEPNESIGMLKNKFEKLNQRLAPILKKHNIKLLEYGISPKTTYRRTELLPKRRYHLMANYLWGILSDVMMRETAGIQICIDFKSEEDAIRKFRLANILSPFITAICANSPIRGGVDTGYKSFRSLSWLNTDNERCPFMSKKLFENKYSFSTYIDEVMETPMIFINREDPVFINGKMNFRQFMKRGYEEWKPTLNDFNLHANLYFPDVRLRNFIEIRNHDCCGKGMPYALMALYKGILYNNDAMSEIEKIVSKFSYYQIAELRYSVPKTALATKIGRTSVNEIAREFVDIAYSSLHENFRGEEHFLEPIIEIVEKGMSPADKILKNWNGSWNRDLSKLIEYITN